MVDKHGKFEMSNIVSAACSNQELLFIIKPNSANNYFVITQNATASSNALVNTTDFFRAECF